VSVRTAIVFIASLGAAAGALSAPAAPSDPLVIVNSLYAPKAAPSYVERLFAADLAAAYHKDTGRSNEAGAVGLAALARAQDRKITDLKVFWAPSPADLGPPPVTTSWPGKGRGARLPPVETPAPKAVEAAFRRFGKPHAVFYSFCRNVRGELRIADIYSAGPDGWSLRRRLKLDPERVRC
jgi:hypothetical protein